MRIADYCSSVIEDSVRVLVFSLNFYSFQRLNYAHLRHIIPLFRVQSQSLRERVIPRGEEGRGEGSSKTRQFPRG